MADVEAVCFDLDSTLCVPKQSDSDIHGAVFDRAGIDPKPATEPFRRAFSGLSASAANTVYVGNDHSADVVGAHAAGLQSAWLPLVRAHETAPSAPDPAPTYRLESPTDLSSIL